MLMYLSTQRIDEQEDGYDKGIEDYREMEGDSQITEVFHLESLRRSNLR